MVRRTPCPHPSPLCQADFEAAKAQLLSIKELEAGVLTCLVQTVQNIMVHTSSSQALPLLELSMYVLPLEAIKVWALFQNVEQAF